MTQATDIAEGIKMARQQQADAHPARRGHREARRKIAALLAKCRWSPLALARAQRQPPWSELSQCLLNVVGPEFVCDPTDPMIEGPPLEKGFCLRPLNLGPVY